MKIAISGLTAELGLVRKEGVKSSLVQFKAYFDFRSFQWLKVFARPRYFPIRYISRNRLAVFQAQTISADNLSSDATTLCNVCTNIEMVALTLNVCSFQYTFLRCLITCPPVFPYGSQHQVSIAVAVVFSVTTAIIDPNLVSIPEQWIETGVDSSPVRI